MSPALLLRFSDETGAAERLLAKAAETDDIAVVPLSQLDLATLRRLRARGLHLGLAGSPPASEIGYGLTPLIALLSGARRVTAIDTKRLAVASSSSWRFVAGTLPPAVLQLAVSAGYIALQRVAARTLPAIVERRRRALAPVRNAVVYLRPHAGVPASVGGSITHTHGVIRSLRSLGAEVDAYTADTSIAATAAAESDPPCQWNVVPVNRACKAIPASTAAGTDSALLRAAGAAARHADFVYQRHSRFSLAGAAVSAWTGTPLFLEYNGSEVFFGAHWQPTPLAGQLLACEDAALAAAARVFVVSEVERRLLIERGVPEWKIVVNPNGVEPERFDVGGGTELRRELGLDENAEVVGFVGTFGPWHGAPMLARAFVRVRRVRPHVRLLLVGSGAELSEVERTLAQGGVADAAMVIGNVSPAEIPRYLDVCDVLASPHVQPPGDVEFFGSPTKLFEYMAAQKPIVASSVGQISDVLTDAETALLVPPDEDIALADALVRALDDRELAAKIARNARRTACERHTWKRNAMRVLEALDALREERER